MADALPQIEKIKEENEAMRKRIEEAKAVTDDNVMDEASGMARATMADACSAREGRVQRRAADGQAGLSWWQSPETQPRGAQSTTWPKAA